MTRIATAALRFVASPSPDPVLALDRQASIISALVALGIASLVVAAGAIVLLVQERRRARDD